MVSFISNNVCLRIKSMLEKLGVLQLIFGMKLQIFLPDEKSENTIGRPIVPYRKVIDGINICIENRM